MSQSTKFKEAANDLVDWLCLKFAELRPSVFRVDNTRDSDRITYELTHLQGEFKNNTAGKLTITTDPYPSVTISEPFLSMKNFAIPLIEILRIDGGEHKSTSFGMLNTSTPEGLDEIPVDVSPTLGPLWRMMRLRPSDFTDRNGLPDNHTIVHTLEILTTAYAQRKRIEPLLKKLHLTYERPQSSDESEELDLIRSSHAKLSGHVLFRTPDNNSLKTDYKLFSPAGEEVASLSMSTGKNPWIMIGGPFIAHGTLQECLLISPQGQGSLMRFAPENEESEGFVMISDSAALRQIADRLPRALKKTAYSYDRPKDKDVYALLCFVADSYQRMLNFEETLPPSADEPRIRRMMPRFEREGIPTP